MNFLPIYRTLQADVAVKAAVSQRIYEDVAPLNTAVPYLVWQAVSAEALQNIDCPAIVDKTMYQIMVYDTDPKRAYDTRDVVRRALETQSWIHNASINHYEPDTKLYARGFDASWHLDR